MMSIIVLSFPFIVAAALIYVGANAFAAFGIGAFVFICILRGLTTDA